MLRDNKGNNQQMGLNKTDLESNEERNNKDSMLKMCIVRSHFMRISNSAI
jgi:hypothetical protein